ncbi:MAG: hypothetical protein ACR2N8_02995 [Parvibaculales bacterium]
MFNKKDTSKEIDYDYCPMVKGACLKHKCKWYFHILGPDPQTGETMDKWDCNQNLIATGLLELGRISLHTTSTVQAFRNDVDKIVKGVSQPSALPEASEQKLIQP